MYYNAKIKEQMLLKNWLQPNLSLVALVLFCRGQSYQVESVHYCSLLLPLHQFGYKVKSLLYFLNSQNTYLMPGWQLLFQNSKLPENGSKNTLTEEFVRFLKLKIDNVHEILQFWPTKEKSPKRNWCYYMLDFTELSM